MAARAGPLPALSMVAGNDGTGDADDWATSYLAPRMLLLAVAIGYGTNFPIGRYLNEALPAAASTSGRFFVATLALSPYLPKLRSALVGPCVLSGILDSIGYCAQSVALVDTPAAKVSFLGTLTILWIPILSSVIDGRRYGVTSAPQLWLAAVLCLSGVALLELAGLPPDALMSSGLASGDLWAILQALGFGSSFYLIERVMMEVSDDPAGDGQADDLVEQTLAITAVNVGVVAMMAALWALADGLALGPFATGPSAGWLLEEATRTQYALPGALLSPSTGPALLWTGLITTALTRVGETRALGQVSASDASLIVSTEPLWATAFGVLLLGEVLGRTEALGGLLVVVAPIVSSASPEAVLELCGWSPAPGDADT
jgi:drug/metabolite transporter (DMT)-like permease